MNDQINNRVVSFLIKVGIPTLKGIIPKNSFLPNVLIRDGGLIYNDDTAPSDLLHEAGHLACIPTKYRHLCQADMDKSVRKIWDIAEKAGDIQVDGDICRALMQSSDPEATAWAWAAGKYLGIPDEEIVLDHQYEGNGEETRTVLNAKCYFGINGLRAAGFFPSVKLFPKMDKWIAA